MRMQLTAACLRHGEHLAALPGEAARARSRRLFAEVTAATMTATLAHLRDRYGGAEAYLLDGGLPPADLPVLRARLTEAPV
ncbi:tyrosine-protein phosphatase [Nonomuraea sp. B5E05]|uniref:tyrosine-protein phosphatase n=1 Tax=Nonomuraea sp. B5E05 TaxID=3153569 RepID=UPI00326144CD